MNGGLFKSASRFALVAAAGIVSGGIAAQAADLGGNCCADLEERVAELEATTARKGNRKVKLTVSGHINEAIIFWDDGAEKNAYVVSNNNSRSRFRFVGDAKINADWSAGYLMEIGVRYGNSSNRSQNAVDAIGNSSSLDIRHSAWWIDNKHLGRVWVGMTSTATDGITEINLANVNNTGPDDSGYNAGFVLRRNNGTLAQDAVGTAATRVTWGSIRSGSNFNVGEGDRAATVKYVSPTLVGFTLQAAFSDDDKYDAALRYAGEFSGFRIAAGIGYQQINSSAGAGNGGCANIAAAPNVNSAVDCNALGMSASLMHVPTGLYVTGSYGELRDENRKKLVASANDKDKSWYVQAGIEQNWFGIGKTTLYGEYGVADTGMAITGGAAVNALNLAGVAANIADAQVTHWGLGINQEISAAAMDMYLNYKHFDADVNTSANGGQVGKVNRGVQDFQTIMMGAIIRF